jgi:hypothetical protein
VDRRHEHCSAWRNFHRDQVLDAPQEDVHRIKPDRDQRVGNDHLHDTCCRVEHHLFGWNDIHQQDTERRLPRPRWNSKGRCEHHKACRHLHRTSFGTGR